MMAFELLLLLFLIVSAIAACLVKKLLNAVIIFSVYSVVMSVLWLLLESPDLAITEAAAGTGISGILMFVVLRKIRVIEKEENLDAE